MHKYLFELFDAIEAVSGDRSKVKALLVANRSKPLAVLFMAAYGHPQPLLKEDDLPKYRPDDAPLGMSYSTLTKAIMRVEYFMKPTNKRVPLKTLQRMYINICEGLHPREAEIFTDVILKRLFVKGLDYEVINAAFGENFLPAPKEPVHASGNQA